MPRIELKANSPEYKDKSQQKQKLYSCEFPGCPMFGEHKAPKHRGLNEYYFFCIDHVKDYNKSWDFFDGMNEREVEDHMLRSLYGDRPTWKSDMGTSAEDMLNHRAWQTYHGTSEEKPRAQARGTTFHHNSPEYHAMATLGVEPPLDIKEIKKRYKELAKKHHPDHNPDKEGSEEVLKEINMAYTVLKDAFEKYEKLDK